MFYRHYRIKRVMRFRHTRGLFSMSCSHNRMTEYPSRLNFLDIRLSRLMFSSILSFQNFFRGFFFLSYWKPCQKSPSQNMAVFLPTRKSGFPKIFGCCVNFNLLERSMFRVVISIFVFFPRILDMTQLRFSFEKISAIGYQSTRFFLGVLQLPSLEAEVRRFQFV